MNEYQVWMYTNGKVTKVMNRTINTSHWEKKAITLYCLYRVDGWLVILKASSSSSLKVKLATFLEWRRVRRKLKDLKKVRIILLLLLSHLMYLEISNIYIFFLCQLGRSEKFKNILVQYCENTSLHGFRYIVSHDSSWMEKIVWGLVKYIQKKIYIDVNENEITNNEN